MYENPQLSSKVAKKRETQMALPFFAKLLSTVNMHKIFKNWVLCLLKGVAKQIIQVLCPVDSFNELSNF